MALVAPLRSRRVAGELLALVLVASVFAGCGSDVAPGAASAGAGGAPAGISGAAGSSAGVSAGGSNGGNGSAGATAGGSAGNAGGMAGTQSIAGAAGLAGAAGVGGAPLDVSAEGDGDLVVGPDYPKDPNLTDLGKPKGKRFTFRMKASDSQIFKGDDATLTMPVTNPNWDRGVTVYVPALYQDGTPAPILVLQEGQIDNVSRALDNLTLATDPLQKLPPFIAIAIDNGSGRDGSDGKGSERGLEYDTLSDRYSRFVNSEVLPAVLANTQIKSAYPNLKLTSDPDGRGAMGCSSGGAAAFSMGWFATDSFHRIITYSGTFVAQQNETQPEAKLYPFGAWEYHSDLDLIANTSAKPLRVFLDCSENDLGATDTEAGHHNWVMANQRMAAALKAKAYHYRFTFAKGLGHCDQRVFDLTLAQTLSWVWRGYGAR